MPFIYLSYAFSIWMIVDAWKRGAQAWWWVIILVPFGEVVYFIVMKLPDFIGEGRDSSGGRYEVRCRSCRYFSNLDTRGGVVCTVSGRAELKSTARANACIRYKKSNWL